MKVLVAGGGGFIGSHLVDSLLGRGDRVLIVDSFITGRRSNIAHLDNHPDCQLIEVDICTKMESVWHDLGPFGHESTNDHGTGNTDSFDAVLNFASPASPDDFATKPLEILLAGSIGNTRLVQLATESDARFLLASTSEVYGDPEVHPQPETYNGSVNVCGPRACYDEAKRFAEATTLAYERTHGTDVAIARIFNTYGERMDPTDGRVINTFIRQALNDEPLTIHGDGTQTRSFCHVDDMVTGLLLLLDDTTTRGPINLGNPAEITMNELAETIIEIIGSSSSITHIPLPYVRLGDPKRRCPDTTDARLGIHFRPEVTLGAGLERMVDHFLTHEAVV